MVKYKYKNLEYFVENIGEKIINRETQMILRSVNGLVVCSETFFEKNFKLV